MESSYGVYRSLISLDTEIWSEKDSSPVLICLIIVNMDSLIPLLFCATILCDVPQEFPRFSSRPIGSLNDISIRWVGVV